MAKAIAHGLLGKFSGTITASYPSAKRHQKVDGVLCDSDNEIGAKKADILILAVKPNVMPQVWPKLSPILSEKTLVISIAAGLSLHWFNQHSAKSHPFIRAMPNTPSAIGLGATPMFANPRVTQHQREMAEMLFGYIGLCDWVKKEDYLDILTALSGSGPAYVFLFLQSLIEGAIKLGLPEPLAKKFAFQTLKGAEALAFQHQGPLKQLIEQVTSPKGTTSAALQVLNDGSFATLITHAIEAAAHRAEELRRENDQRSD